MITRPGVLRRSWWRDEGYYALRPRPRSPIGFWPELPHPHTTVWKALMLLGHPIRRAAGPDGATFAWEDSTRSRLVPGAVNGSSVDISKTTVDRAMRDVFGYALEVDPATHRGPMVVKSEKNTAHDGRIVNGPQPREPGRVYQLLVDNSDGDEVVDLRVAKVGWEFPAAYRKRRPVAVRFENTNTHAALLEPHALFTADELAAVAAVATNVGLDFGEIDVLRDRDGRMYVVDVNKTPWGPPRGIRTREGWRAMRVIAESVRALLH